MCPDRQPTSDERYERLLARLEESARTLASDPRARPTREFRRRARRSLPRELLPEPSRATRFSMHRLAGLALSALLFGILTMPVLAQPGGVVVTVSDAATTVTQLILRPVTQPVVATATPAPAPVAQAPTAVPVETLAPTSAATPAPPPTAAPVAAQPPTASPVAPASAGSATPAPGIEIVVLPQTAPAPGATATTPAAASQTPTVVAGTPTVTVAAVATASPTVTITPMPGQTATVSATISPTASATATVTTTPTVTMTATPTWAPALTPTGTPGVQPTTTRTPVTATPAPDQGEGQIRPEPTPWLPRETPAPAPASPTSTPAATRSAMPTATPSPTPSRTPAPGASPTVAAAIDREREALASMESAPPPGGSGDESEGGQDGS